VKNDPERFAKWTADQDARKSNLRAMYSRNMLFEVAGCGHKQIVGCHPHTKGSAVYPDWADCSEVQRVPDGDPSGIGPAPKVPKGMVTLSVTTAGAKVFLVTGSKRRPIYGMQLDLEVDLTKDWTIVATKPGYADFTRHVETG
jgi:hypothetical protein